MKKLTAFLLAALMIFALAACAGNNSGTNSNTSITNSVIDNSSTAQSSNDSTAQSNNDSSTQSSNDSSTAQNKSDNSAAPDNSQSKNNNQSDDTVKILVAYFSATNTTEGVAKTIAGSLGADLYEITPKQPYTSADLNYHDDKSRSTIEMNDPNARPAISGSVENMAQYDIVFIGYPIWWGEAPRILNTFVESYNFSGKTIVPFCTSGGSGVGSSSKKLESLTSGATWLSGTRLNGNASKSSVAEWINGLGLNIKAK